MSAVAKPAPGEGAAESNREAAVCELLVARGRLKDSDLARARRLHEESPEGTLTALMARLGLVSERDLAEAWSELLHTPLLAAREAPELPPAELDLSVRFLKLHHVVPVRDGDDGLALLVSDPADPYPLLLRHPLARGTRRRMPPRSSTGPPARTTPGCAWPS